MLDTIERGEEMRYGASGRGGNPRARDSRRVTIRKYLPIAFDGKNWQYPGRLLRILEQPKKSYVSRAPTVLSMFSMHPRKFGSLEEFAVFLSRALHERGWRSVLVFSGPSAPTVVRHFEASGAVTEVCRFDTMLHLCMDLFRVVRKYRSHLVHFHFLDAFSILPIVARLAGADRVIFTDHNRALQRFGFLTRLKLRLWDRLVLAPLGIQVLAISDFIRQTLVGCHQMAPERVRIVYNGVNLQRFRSLSSQELSGLRQELGIEPGRRIVVSAAHLIPEKGISILLRAAKIVVSNNADVVFLIVGDGPLTEQLHEEARQLGIDKNVRFTGLRSDVHRLMALADVVAVPSVWQEPAGLVVVEAMAAGRPVVASRVGGIPEYFDDGVTGVLVEPQSPAKLAEALRRLLNSPDEAALMGQAGRKRAEMYFSMERWVEDTLSIHEKALQ